MTLISANLRAAVEQRAGQRCQYCRLAQATQVATFPVDHIVPVTEGGETVRDNLAIACPRCNATKWNQVSGHHTVSNQVVPLFNPRTQIWSATDPTRIEPLTPTGRVTRTLLETNGPRPVQVRQLLTALGLHPLRGSPAEWQEGENAGKPALLPRRAGRIGGLAGWRPSLKKLLVRGMLQNEIGIVSSFRQIE